MVYLKRVPRCIHAVVEQYDICVSLPLPPFPPPSPLLSPTLYCPLFQKPNGPFLDAGILSASKQQEFGQHVDHHDSDLRTGEG